MASTPSTQTSPTTTSTSTNIAYRPVYKHWFHKFTSESKRIWIPFSFSDSMLLESSFAQGHIKTPSDRLMQKNTFRLNDGIPTNALILFL